MVTKFCSVCNTSRTSQVRSGQVVILKARPAMDAAVMSFHLSLSPTSSSSLTRFRRVVMPYNDDKPALFKSFSMLSIHRCFAKLGVQQVVFLSASNYELWMATSLVHSGDMSTPFHSPFSYSILCYFLPCSCSYLHIA